MAEHSPKSTKGLPAGWWPESLPRKGGAPPAAAQAAAPAAAAPAASGQAPKASAGQAPKSSGGQLPKSSGGQAPKSSAGAPAGQAPKASGGQAPKSSGGQAPKASGGAPPAAAAAAPAKAAPAAPGKAAPAAPGKAAPAAPKPPAPPKPVPVAQVLTKEMRDVVGRKIIAEYPPAGSITRRAFISWCGVAWTTFAAASAAGGAICARFMFPNVLFEPPMSFKAGPASEYSSIGMVYELFKAKFGVWIVREEKSIFALSTVCTHLGCTPNWLAAEQKFKCPCHGSGFYKTGINFEGPAPRPLERYRITLADDGQIQIDKSKKYQYEMGQWTDPESFLVV